MMRSIFISLPTVGDVRSFVEQISSLEGNFDLVSGVYIMDARSLMSVLSMDRSQPLELIIEKDTAETMKILGKMAIADKNQ